ncbi:MAG: tetratricopeptide repeat protein, partial [Ktedonobacteraceae bacterium]
HRLVQAVLKDSMDIPTYHQWAERVVQAVYLALPTEVDYGPHARYERCLPHAQECARLIEQEQLTSYSARWLPYQIGRYFWEHARYAEAEVFYQHSMRIMEQALGPDHPQVAYPLNNLANLYKDQGKYAEAEPLYQRALHIWEQALGPDHPITRTVVRNYAILLRKTGREAEANELEARFPSP